MSRGPRRRRTAVLAAALVGLSLGAVSSQVPAGATTLDYVGSTTGTASTITTHVGDSYQRVTHPTGTVSATLDDTAHTVTKSVVAFDPTYTDTFSGPFGVLVYVRSDIAQTGTSSGTATPSATAGVENLSVTTTAHMGLTVYRAGADRSQHPATDQKLTDPTKCFADLTLSLTGTADRRTGDLALSADPFAIPTFPNGTPDPTKTCGIAAGALNQQLAGPHNRIELHFSGSPTAAHYTGVSTGTSSSVSVQLGSRLARTLHPAGSLTADIDFTKHTVSNVSTVFQPMTLSDPTWGMSAGISLVVVGSPTSTIAPSGTTGIDQVTVDTTVRMGLTVTSGAWTYTDPTRCAVDIPLHLVGSVDRGTDAVTLHASGFTIPTFTVAACGSLAPPLSMPVSGSHTDIALGFVDGHL